MFVSMIFFFLFLAYYQCYYVSYYGRKKKCVTMVVLLWLITDEEEVGTNLKRRRRKRERRCKWVLRREWEKWIFLFFWFCREWEGERRERKRNTMSLTLENRGLMDFRKLVHDRCLANSMTRRPLCRIYCNQICSKSFLKILFLKSKYIFFFFLA